MDQGGSLTTSTARRFVRSGRGVMIHILAGERTRCGRRGPFTDVPAQEVLAAFLCAVCTARSG